MHNTTVLKSKRRSEDGYTLMELLVVLAILGMLTAIATPFISRYLEGAKVRTARTELTNISASLDLFKFDVGRYPTTQEGLTILIAPSSGVENWNGPYVKKSGGFSDPWGHSYNYKSPGEHGDFDLFSYGPTGKADTGGKPEIANW